MGSTSETLDLTEELRLRRWARENYVPSGERDSSWHPVIFDEMEKRDREEARNASNAPAQNAQEEALSSPATQQTPDAQQDEELTAPVAQENAQDAQENAQQATADLDIAAEIGLNVSDDVSWGELFVPIAELHCLHGPHELPLPHAFNPAADSQDVKQAEAPAGTAVDSSGYFG